MLDHKVCNFFSIVSTCKPSFIQPKKKGKKKKRKKAKKNRKAKKKTERKAEDRKRTGGNTTGVVERAVYCIQHYTPQSEAYYALKPIPYQKLLR